MIIQNYHGSANGDSQKVGISEPGCAEKPLSANRDALKQAGSANGDATLQEVVLKNGAEEGTPPQYQNKPLPPNLSEPAGWETRAEYQRRLRRGA